MMNQALQYAQPAGGYEQPVVVSVARVTIHAFAANQHTVQIIQQATADPRMSRAHVTIQLGGIMAAIQVFQGQPTPNVLLVESNSQRDGMLAELAQLAQVCGPDTRVIVIG